jgi:hypothetical protein
MYFSPSHLLSSSRRSFGLPMVAETYTLLPRFKVFTKPIAKLKPFSSQNLSAVFDLQL